MTLPAPISLEQANRFHHAVRNLANGLNGFFNWLSSRSDTPFGRVVYEDGKAQYQVLGEGFNFSARFVVAQGETMAVAVTLRGPLGAELVTFYLSERNVIFGSPTLVRENVIGHIGQGGIDLETLLAGFMTAVIGSSAFQP